MKEAKGELLEFRRELHRTAERSGEESRTAACVRSFLAQHCAPDEMSAELGGHGIAATYRGSEAGPTVLLRAELDALPIPETCKLEYGSRDARASHKCGHDGHMAILAGVGSALKERRPARGSVVLLFQPAEETGAGASLVLNDPGFEAIKPNYVFALHNLPGFPRGSVVTRAGVFASASRGFIVEYEGATSHAAEPQNGLNPAPAIASTIAGLESMAQHHSALHEAAQATVIHARLGERAFGTSPGEGCVMATLRAHTDRMLNTLAEECLRLAAGTASAYGLEHRTAWTEPFPSTVNDAGCTKMVERAARETGLDIVRPEAPFAWSEDFGHFTAAHSGALFGLGAGEEHPALHAPYYDFPDELIGTGAAVFSALIEQCTACEKRQE